jgi:hypothetical protein
MPSLPDDSVHFSIYSPPFAGLYHYSSSPRDLSNSRDYPEFLEHYEFVVREIQRLTLPGRMTAVHCMDISSGNSGIDYLMDFPGDIIRLHNKIGFRYIARYHVWKGWACETGRWLSIWRIEPSSRIRHVVELPAPIIFWSFVMRERIQIR